MGFNKNLLSEEFPKFLQGPFLKATLTLLPSYAEKEIKIIVPYLIQSDILETILQIPENIQVKLYTRNSAGYLPNIRHGAQPALDTLAKMPNLQLFISNKIHAKIWKIDDKFVIVHSMNGTPTSENINFEAGIISIQTTVISDVENYFNQVEAESNRVK
ncbi:MAG: phosphatidylserine/phosphatidylglycerophosphate/cardiolipin synthase family protein [Candidatus Heimdallarchaeota archaeon]|nr:phosphatidylserine/phosphatidylglycerophosphate/cardiolipin synthase family protein [Candidatus Heimdallarchaeota archaeon]